MTKLIALLQFLLALAGVHVGGTDWTSNIHDHGQVLSSRVHAQDGVARFECIDSSSGRCHYTLYPDACAGKTCADTPLRQFSVASGDSRQFAGLAGFRPCVDVEGAVLRPDCTPRAPAAKH